MTKKSTHWTHISEPRLYRLVHFFSLISLRVIFCGIFKVNRANTSKMSDCGLKQRRLQPGGVSTPNPAADSETSAAFVCLSSPDAKLSVTSSQDTASAGVTVHTSKCSDGTSRARQPCLVISLYESLWWHERHRDRWGPHTYTCWGDTAAVVRCKTKGETGEK